LHVCDRRWCASSLLHAASVPGAVAPGIRGKELQTSVLVQQEVSFSERQSLAVVLATRCLACLGLESCVPSLYLASRHACNFVLRKLTKAKLYQESLSISLLFSPFFVSSCMLSRVFFVAVQVSYGYALAMALAGGRLLATGAGLHPLAKAQALVLVAYGVRLGVFLLQRELTLERFKVMAKRIDEKVLSSFFSCSQSLLLSSRGEMRNK